MNDEQMRSRLDAWGADHEVPRPMVQPGVASVMARVPYVRQRSRRWPFPESFRRGPRATANPTESHPGPTPAANGHTPTVIGRTSTMFSPVKAITAGALVFALSGAFLIAQPFDQQASVPGAEAEEVAPTWVTGNFEPISTCGGHATEFDGAVIHQWNYVCTPKTSTASDPRLSGEVASTWSDDIYTSDNGPMAVNVEARYLRNDGGEWVCSSVNLFEQGGVFPRALTDTTYTCAGQGGYAGLSAVLVAMDDSADYPFVGLIFSGGLPPLPEPPTAG